MKNIIETLNEYIPEDNPKKWAKLNSTITYRRLHLTLLKEIVVLLRELLSKK